MNPNPNQTPADVQDILAQCLNSTEMYCTFFFPEIFYSPFSSLHRAITDAIDSGHRKIAIAASRGLGKTSIIMNGLVAKAISFDLYKYIVYITGSADLAIAQTENLKSELLSNEIITSIFGRIDSHYDDDSPKEFGKKSYVTSNGIKVLPRGAGQQVRGISHSYKGKKYRPGLIIFDDLEDKELIQSSDQRKKLKEWFYSDPLKCVSAYDDNYTFIYIDTIKHEDSLLEQLLQNPDWHGIRLDICDDEFNTLDPLYMTTDEIKAEYEEHKREGLEDVFFRERRSIPMSTKDQSFKPEYFKYYEEYGDELIIKTVGEEIEIERIPTRELVNVVICDPAKTDKMESADSAVVGIGVHRSSQKIFIRQIVSGKFKPDTLYSHLFQMIRYLNAYIFGVEVTGLEDFISQPIKNLMQIERIYATFIELKARRGHDEKGKILRIRELVPYYQRGFVYHNKPQCGKLETQLLSFPRSKTWDVMDATAYINEIIDREEGRLLFEPPDMDDQDVEKEYEELDNEPAIMYSGHCP